MSRNEKQRDVEQPDEGFDHGRALAVLLNSIPAAFVKLFPELEKPEGMGRKWFRQFADHELALLDSLATARREGGLDAQQMADYVAVLRRFLPVLERVEKLHDRIPQQVVDDARLYGPSDAS